MSYNKEIEIRIMKITSRWKNHKNKRMFGGVGHMINGNMFTGVIRDFLILRLGTEGGEKALKLKHVRPFDITGRPMKGWVMVEQEGFRTGAGLRKWLEKARNFAKTLPPK